MVAFSKELKKGTSKSHSAAENSKFVSSFLRGVLDPEEYRRLIAQFYFVYSTMEKCIKESDDRWVEKNYYPELERVESLSKDLEYYYGPNWNEVIKPSEGCVQYVERIHEVADKDPYLLVGHHYTRYLGDLSGGQILKGIAEKALNLPKNEGLHFYDFPDITDKKEFKTKYRSGLDKVTTDSHKINDIIAEANYAFRLNMYMFDELSGSTKDAINSAAKVFLQTLVGAFKKG